MNRPSKRPSGANALTGHCVLVIEDDYLLAEEMALTLREQGAEVLGPVPDAARGRALSQRVRPDCAVLDVNLKGQFVFELARELQARGVRIVFATGYDSSFLPEDLRQSTCLQKPIHVEDLVRAIREETARPQSGAAIGNESRQSSA
jgi:DNA-binding response OmpR family regulator